MSIRTIFLVLTMPLFLLVTGINGAVLYFQEQSEISRALTEQALAAAIVTAEFVVEMEDPQSTLSAQQRQSALDAAGQQIDDLQGLYLAKNTDGAAPLILPLTTGSIAWVPPVILTDTNAGTATHRDETSETGFFAASYPAGAGRAVIARIDANPLRANAAQMIQIILLSLLGAAVMSVILSILVARIISRELHWNRAALTEPESHSSAPGSDTFTILETSDLADAVRLMKASRDAEETRHSRQKQRANAGRSSHSAAQAIHAEQFPNMTIAREGFRAAVRLCGEVEPGSFYAIADGQDGKLYVALGKCEAEKPHIALANAAAARRFIEEHLAEFDPRQCLDLAKQAYGIEAINWASVSTKAGHDGRCEIICLANDQTTSDARKIAKNYGSHSPDQILETIASVLCPDGIFVAIGRAEVG